MRSLCGSWRRYGPVARLESAGTISRGDTEVREGQTMRSRFMARARQPEFGVNGTVPRNFDQPAKSERTGRPVEVFPKRTSSLLRHFYVPSSSADLTEQLIDSLLSTPLTNPCAPAVSASRREARTTPQSSICSALLIQEYSRCPVSDDVLLLPQIPSHLVNPFPHDGAPGCNL